MSTYENQTGRLAPQSLLQQRYVIIGQAGRGGMGAVYQAIDTRSANRHVAIKEMSQAHLNTAQLADATAQFQREAKMLASLSHPNLPRVYDAFNEQGRTYLVMDFIVGKTLTQLMRETGGQPFPVDRLLICANQLCDVLSYLHQHHPPIIFRDLKPSNVMVTEHGHVYLIDFGIARFFKEGQQQDTTYLGSPGYAPPEQHGTSQTNPRSDIYSLGATLHYCLTGRDPYHAQYRFAFPPVRQLNQQVPIELDQLIARMLAVDEQERPASAAEVQQVFLKISGQAADYTSGLAPAFAPTQYIAPAPSAPAPIPNSSNQAPIHAPTVAVNSPAPSPALNRTLQGVSSSQVVRARSTTPIWSARFLTLFVCALVLLVVGSIFAFNIPNPYGASNSAGLDHAVELGLTLILLIVACSVAIVTRSIVPRTILLVVALAALISSFAFGVQTLLDIGIVTTNPFPAIDLNLLFTTGLAGASLITLLWLIRPLLWLDRTLLLAVFGVATACALLQYPGGDGDVAKHLLLLVTLIALIQGMLLAGQMERVRQAKKI